MDQLAEQQDRCSVADTGSVDVFGNCGALEDRMRYEQAGPDNGHVP